MFLGLFRRPKEEADKLIYYQRFRRFPLGNPRGSAVGWQSPSHAIACQPPLHKGAFGVRGKNKNVSI